MHILKGLQSCNNRKFQTKRNCVADVSVMQYMFNITKQSVFFFFLIHNPAQHKWRMSRWEWKWTLLTSSQLKSWKDRERESERERSWDGGFCFSTLKKREQWMSDWLNEWEAGWSWEGLWLCGSAEVNSASSEGWKGGKTDWALKRRTPCAWGGISQDDLLEWESEREREAFASVKKLQRKRSVKKCWYARQQDGHDSDSHFK